MSITQITRVSTNAAGEQAESASWVSSVSADGRFVAFASGASNLVPGDTNNWQDVFVKDLQTGAVTRVSTNAAGAQGNSASYEPAISADGRFVAFWSYASNLVPGDTNGFVDGFVKDLQTGAVTRINTDAAGRQSNGSVLDPPSISADGRYVTFRSEATDLVPGDTNNFRDVFVKDLQTGAVIRASVTAAGGQGNSESYNGSISADGRFVAFESWAWNLVPGDTNDHLDVFVKNLQTGAIARVSTDATGRQGNDHSGQPVLSADGRFVAFYSASSNLVPGDTNDSADVFVKDTQTGALTRVSTDASGGQSNAAAVIASISADGRFVVFESRASNLMPGDTNDASDVFVKDIQTGAIARVSTDAVGGQGNGLSWEPVISADGRFIAFDSSSSDLVPGDTNDTSDSFITPNPLLGGGTPPTSLTSGNDTWTGTVGNDTVLALAGDDSLDGAAGSDFLVGGSGNDTLAGGAGADVLQGGEGDDTYIVGVGDQVFGEPQGRGIDRVFSGADFTLGDGLNHLYLTGAAAQGTGNAGNNVIGGNNAGNVLDGDGGADQVFGHGGNDTLIGSSGNDTLKGGGGADRFDFTSLNGRVDVDVIADYRRSDGDVVDLSDPAGFTVLGVVAGSLRIALAGEGDVVEFRGITSAADILFV